MGKIVNAMALSHAFAMRDPSTWDEGRRQNRSRYIERQGKEPAVPSGLAAANPTDDAIRFEHIKSAQEKLRKELTQSKPDIVIVVGDDQNENLNKELMPQIAVYTGGDYAARACNDGAFVVMPDARQVPIPPICLSSKIRSRSATGFKLYLGLTLPLGRPK